MKVELKPYPAYKPSENLWIGEIPREWGAWRLRFVAPLQGGFAFPSSQFSFEGIPVVRMTNLKRGAIDLTDAACVPSGPDRFALKPNDLLLGMSGSIGETGSLGNYAEVGEPDVPCFLNQRVGRFLPKSNLNRVFLKYLLQSKLFTEPLLIDVTGTAQFNISPGQVGNIRAPLPDTKTQQQIAAFLDRETAKIDRLMEVRRKQVERLQEQRTAVIHHAVTRGLDPKAKLKPSGVEWLPHVPAGWTVKRLKYWAKHIAAQVSTMPDGHAYLALEHVESKTGRILPNESAEFDSNVKLFKANDVLFGRLRPYLAKVALPAFDGVCVGELMVLRPNAQELRPRYLQLRLLTPDFISLVDGSTQGAKMPRANWSFVGDISLAFPPTDEQEAIIAHIDRETAKLDTLAAKYRRELELLAEYRASLISHAVTGKIDVRGLVPTSATERS